VLTGDHPASTLQSTYQPWALSSCHCTMIWYIVAVQVGCLLVPLPSSSIYRTESNTFTMSIKVTKPILCFHVLLHRTDFRMQTSTNLSPRRNAFCRGERHIFLESHGQHFVEQMGNGQCKGYRTIVPWLRGFAWLWDKSSNAISDQGHLHNSHRLMWIAKFLLYTLKHILIRSGPDAPSF